MIQGDAWWENETLPVPSSLAAFACLGTRSSCTPSSAEQSDYHNDDDASMMLMMIVTMMKVMVVMMFIKRWTAIYRLGLDPCLVLFPGLMLGLFII